jgi:hypothetical protein
MSAIDKRLGRKIPAFVRREDSPGMRLDSGPYIGKIKNNLDTLRAGRIEVWIPDLGGDEDAPQSWRTVHYASPFFGTTNQTEEEEGKPDKKNTFKSVKHTYGFWFTPPDVNNFVICTFIAGDPMRGFWFACIPNQLGQHMVPAIGSSTNNTGEGIEDAAASEVFEQGLPHPVVEFNENTGDPNKLENFANTEKPIHEEQVKILGEQGLNKDTARGPITSSSQRESPSAVFGISTPGRPMVDQESKDGKDIKSDDLKVYARKGGHTFVMDDGDYAGKDQLMRLRTATGHQIMMNDTEQIIYISHSTGKVWLELDSNGNMHVFGDGSASFRMKEGINFYTESDFIVHAEGDIRLKAKNMLSVETNTTNMVSTEVTTVWGSDINLGASGDINLDCGGNGSFQAGGDITEAASTIKMNSGAGTTVEKPEELEPNDFADAERDGSYKWKSEPDKIKSIVKILPTHEPWPDHTAPASGGAGGGAGGGAAAGGQEAGGEVASGGENGGLPAGGADAAGGDTGEVPGVTTQSGGTAAAGTATGGPGQRGPSAVIGGGGANPDGTPNVRSGAPSPSAGIDAAAGQSVRRAADPSFLNRSDNPTPNSGVGPLSADQTKALKTQIAYSESSFNYGAENQFSYLGKYQFGSAALTDQGYIKPDAYARYGQDAVNYPSSWTGKDGINSKDAFKNNAGVQERAMDNLLQRNYNTLSRTGGVKSTDDPATVAGMLSTSHLLGAGGAKKWRETGVGADANKTTGSTYFNQGRHAVNVLANNKG